jgi:ribonuclease PH
MNVVMNQAGEYVEIQGTAEAQAFTADQLQAMLKLADQGIRQLLTYQQQALAAIL